MLMLLSQLQADWWIWLKEKQLISVNLLLRASTKPIKCLKKDSSSTSRKSSDWLKIKENKKPKTSCSQPQFLNGSIRFQTSTWTNLKRKSTLFPNLKPKHQQQLNTSLLNANSRIVSNAFKLSSRLTIPITNWAPSYFHKPNFKSPILPWNSVKMPLFSKAIWNKKKDNSIWTLSELEREAYW